MTCYTAHFTSSIINFCIIAAMVVHRYQKFKKQDVAGFAEHTKQYLLVAVSIGLCAMFPIAWDMWDYLKIVPGECNLMVDQPMTCDSIVSTCSNFFTVLTVTIVITVSCVCISRTTIRLKKYIRKADERANTILQMKRSTNTSRIQATKLLFYFFTINWVPYGLTRFYAQFNPTFPKFQTLATCFHALSTVLSMIIPIIYYKMDGGFQSTWKICIIILKEMMLKMHRRWIIISFGIFFHAEKRTQPILYIC